MRNELEVMKYKEELRVESLEVLEKKSKSLDSSICRKKKMEFDVEEMNNLLEEKRIIREVIIEKKEIKVVIYERSLEDIEVMNYEEVMKGIKNIDSLLCIELGKNDNFRNDEKVEKCKKVREWLIDRKNIVSGSSLGKVNISDVMRKIEDIKDLEELKEWLVEISK